MLVSPADIMNLVELLIRTRSVLNSGSIGVHGKEWVPLGRLTVLATRSHPSRNHFRAWYGDYTVKRLN